MNTSTIFTISGETPSKKNSWKRGQNGQVFLPEEILEWTDNAGKELMYQKCPQHTGNISISAIFYTNKPAKDLDNMFTTLLDCLQANGIIDNDKNVQMFTCRRESAKEHKTEPQAHFSITTL